MVKKAYKKLLSYPIVRMSIIGILLTIFVYRLLLFVTYGDEVSQTIIKWICMGFACLHISVFLISMIRYVTQVQKASHYLHTLPAYAKERLKYDLQTEDRLDDMYFTSEFLLIYQFQFRKKYGFACIPYKEIEEVRISRTNKNVLEILNPQGTVLHMAVFLHTFEGQQITELNKKIFSLKNREQAVRTTEEEQAARDYIAKQKIKKSLSGVPLAVCDFVVILAFLFSLMVAEYYRNEVKLLEIDHALGFTEEALTYGGGTLLFWPSLQFYVVMYGTTLLLLVCGTLFARKVFSAKEDSRSERIQKIRLLLFTAGEMLFILFIGLLYTSDVHTWEQMVQGFQLLF